LDVLDSLSTSTVSPADVTHIKNYGDGTLDYFFHQHLKARFGEEQAFYVFVGSDKLKMRPGDSDPASVALCHTGSDGVAMSLRTENNALERLASEATRGNRLLPAPAGNLAHRLGAFPLSDFLTEEANQPVFAAV
jgi:hypothetical protein